MATPLIAHDVDLSALSTFGLSAKAKQVIYLQSIEELAAPEMRDCEAPLILGGGSNTLFLSDWPRSIWLNQINGISHRVEGDEILVEVGAGESWHELVMHCLNQGWHGIENLAMIPGSVGAAPIQNIGAYGVEVASAIEQVVVWNLKTQQQEVLSAEQCQFGYRDSLFKHSKGTDLLITRVDFKLSKHFLPNIEYASLKQKLTGTDPRALTAEALVGHIIQLRSERLPDPSVVANAGSFFKNPVVDADQYAEIRSRHPKLPGWFIDADQQQNDASNKDASYKISAAWMIDQLGFKGRCVGGICVYENHALVLINQGQGTARDLLSLISEIRQAVQKEFGVRLETEPQLIKA